MGYRTPSFMLIRGVFTIFLVFTYALEERASAVLTLCHSNESSALLRFKKVLDLKHGKLTSWKKGSDCCHWEGVACNNLTGYIIALQLSSITKFGFNDTIINNVDSAMFELQHLELLNLSHNDFNGEIPKDLGKLTTLTYLDLSNCFFSGHIPLEMSRMTQLISLNLSSNYWLTLQRPNFMKLIRGLSNLQELVLDYVDISISIQDVGLALSLPRLQTLSLRDCNIFGPMDDSLVSLRSLSYLDLSWNNLTCVPEFIVNLTSLRVLKLASCDLKGKFPSDIFLLPQIEDVDISLNSELVIDVPLDARLNTSNIRSLDVSGTKQTSGTNFLMAFSRLTQLTYFSMASCGINGRLPSSWHSVGILSVNLRDNNISGPIPEYFNSLFNLTDLDLSGNQLCGMIPSNLFNLPNLRYIYLNNNRLNGWLPNSPQGKSNLEELDLRNNSLSGNITFSWGKLPKLKYLYLPDNNFSGTINFSVFLGMENLYYLDLSYNARLTVETSNASDAYYSNLNIPPIEYFRMNDCGLKTFPSFIQKLGHLRFLDISHNDISGRIPSWMWHNALAYFDISSNSIAGIDGLSNHTELINPSLYYFNISHNLVTGQIPTFFSNFSGLQIVDMSHNKLTGLLPKPLFNHSELEILDMGNNELNDTFPFWLDSLNNLRILNLRSNHLWGHIELPHSKQAFPSLQILDIYDNQFSGSLSIQSQHAQFSSLEMLNLNTNLFSGEVPRFLSNCTGLKDLDLGNNELNDTFPFWLGNLVQLRILNLRSNHLRGHFTFPPSKQTFSSLQILDISGNMLSGSLPGQFFKSLEAMKVLNSTKEPISISISVGYLNTFDAAVTQRIKGQDVVITKVIEAMTIIDLSNNLFNGDIPEEMGSLQGLHQLNISSNNLSGIIPKSLGNLHQLESLDLSSNNLSGSIPEELAGLTFLEVLNLSFNDLEGMIPQGKQFNTFEEPSFKGNPKLCGLQVKKQCSVDGTHNDEENNQEEEKQWEYGAAGVGFAVGLATLTLPIIFIQRVGDWYWDQIDRVVKCLFYIIIYRRVILAQPYTL